MKTQLPTKRIAKTIAESGICSRRQAEKLITLGKVFVNDIKIITPAFFVNANDKIINASGYSVDTIAAFNHFRYFNSREYLNKISD